MINELAAWEAFCVKELTVACAIAEEHISRATGKKLSVKDRADIRGEISSDMRSKWLEYNGVKS